MKAGTKQLQGPRTPEYSREHGHACQTTIVQLQVKTITVNTNKHYKQAHGNSSILSE